MNRSATGAADAARAPVNGSWTPGPGELRGPGQRGLCACGAPAFALSPERVWSSIRVVRVCVPQPRKNPRHLTLPNPDEATGVKE